jgi:hypothetical protein
LPCEYCGAKEPLLFKCKYCGKLFCSRHRLPESHSCPALPERSWQAYKAVAEERSRQARVEANRVETQVDRIWIREVEPSAKRSLLSSRDWVAFLSILFLPSLLYALATSTVQIAFCFLIVLPHAMLLHEMGHFLMAKHYGYRAKIEFGGRAKMYGPFLSVSILRTRYWGRKIEKNETQNIGAMGPLLNFLYGVFCLIFLGRQGFLIAGAYNLYLVLCNLDEVFGRAHGLEIHPLLDPSP